MDGNEGTKRPTLDAIDHDTCMELLASRPVGRLGFVTEEGLPQILPINHGVDGGDIVFRSAKGTKVDVAERLSGSVVAYEVDDFDTGVRTGWSVLATGRIEEVLDTVRVARLERLGLQAWAEEPVRDRWVAIHLEDVSGRRIVER